MQYRLTCCGKIYQRRGSVYGLRACPYCNQENPKTEEVDKEDQVIIPTPFSGDRPYENRPWGSFRVLLDEPNVKVKKITVKAGQRLSLQLHATRDELWKIISGSGAMQIGNHKFDISSGSEVRIDRYSVHRVKAGELNDLVFIEIQTGECQEDDIIRVKDDYNRD